MTYSGHVKTINISSFKAHISEELQSVRKGARLVILDRDNPSAEVIPYKADQPSLISRPPKRTLEFRKLEIVVDSDPLELLMEERGTR